LNKAAENMSAFGTIIYEVDGPVAFIVMSRPEKAA
jgi:hypothetical protein